MTNLFNHRIQTILGHPIGSGFGYRVVLLMVILYFAAGVALIRPVREKIVFSKQGRPGDMQISPRGNEFSRKERTA